MEEDRIREALKEVDDPDIGYDIVSLGFIYGIEVEGRIARIKMTLTTPMCPYGPLLLSMVEKKIRDIGYEPDIELVFDPPWTPDKVDPEIRKKLGI